MKSADNLFDKHRVSPETIFGRLHGLVSKMMDPQAVEAEMSITETGMPILKPRIEFGSERPRGEIIYNGDYLRVLNDALQSVGITIPHSPSKSLILLS
jgi:hypothetical protein